MSTREPILIIEDDSVQRELIERILSDLPYALTFAESKDEAIEAFDKIGHHVVLCDIHLRGNSSGVDVLKSLMEKPNPPVVVMQTVEGGIRQIIQCLRMGAYDYIIKPIVPEGLRQVVKTAFTEAHKISYLRDAEMERTRQLETQQATQRIAQNLMRRQNDKVARALFGNIYTSFTQGKGIGALATLLSMLAGLPKTDDGKNFIVPVDTIELILENEKSLTQMVSVFGELKELVSQDFALFDVTLGEFHEIIKTIAQDIKPLAELKRHEIIISNLPPRFAGKRLKLNWEFMRKAIWELLVNALKFSPPESTVTVLIEYLHTRILVTVINKPYAAHKGETLGIPEEFRRLIFEPFFRISRTLNEDYQTLEYGLGLTLVDKIIQMHKGSIRCTAIRDFESGNDTKNDLIAFEIELPT
ncbi:MAG: Regulator of RpoS [Turneriella sp.]|nr:Regulator of RpoS [Turneriella sp.]